MSSDDTRTAAVTEIERFVAEHLPAAWQPAGGQPPAQPDPHAARAWYDRLGAGGWTVPEWPRAHGGRGMDADTAAAVRAVLARHDADLPVHHFVPVKLIGPAIMAWGSPEQQQRYLPGIATGADMWCQLFSEPGAGSDLASLATRAVRRDDGGWVVDGQKVWSSFADISRYGMLLARTDPELPKNAGISCFIIDMESAGVTVRPLRQITGDEHFSEVFFENVELPADALLGPLNDGWRVALSTLVAERSGLSEESGASGVPVGPLLDLARDVDAWRDATVRDRLAQLVATERALALTNVRVNADPDSSGGPGGSVTKLALSELSQQIAELGFELAGPPAAYWAGDESSWAHDLLDSRRFTIAGGTSEIQRNIIAERVLGLDREPDPDRGRPWREIRRG
ncbi:acyl-CoA dehydrogenase family protein [Mycobacterium sp. 1274756.6]|uniref:acyl-CoA dehydrogenase family protein n=1 Tax=Mycobacterium sp. 1274756.6 TaxID=1834076 RepID=UPI0007FEDB1C|nr:acyl-CoA dehydrogenase family protein [Mycobacterium sp. 1274756.6]OBJ73702.1 acyl-CoA dehydrogenase [Mycobacterium sp. 1274756.6]